MKLCVFAVRLRKKLNLLAIGHRGCWYMDSSAQYARGVPKWAAARAAPRAVRRSMRRGALARFYVSGFLCATWRGRAPSFGCVGDVEGAGGRM